MSDERRVKVTLDLRGSTADKLKAICYARGETASLVVDRWVTEADESGQRVAPVNGAVDDMLRDLIGGR